MSRQSSNNRPASPFPAFTAFAFLLACLLLVLDMLVGGYALGARMDISPVGLPPLLVDLLGLAAYFALLFIPATLIYALRRIKNPAPSLALNFAFPLVAIVAALLLLPSGQPKMASKSLASMMSYVALIILILGLLLRRFERAVHRAPGRVALSGFTLVIITLLSFGVVNRLSLDDWNREMQFTLVMLIVGFSLAALFFYLRGKPRWQLPGRRRLAGVTGLLAVALLMIWGGQKILHRPAPADAHAPNVVLVVFDAMRADAISPYGGKFPTPNFASFAAKSVLFEQAHSPSSSTRDSMTGLFASSYPGELDGNISPDYGLLAPALRHKGYATASLVGNFILNRRIGIHQGFDYRVVVNQHLRYYNPFSLQLPGLGIIARLVADRPGAKGLINTSPLLMGHLNNFLRGKGHHQPFFLWVHFMDPHDPYDPPEKYRRQLGIPKGPWPVFAPHDPDLKTPTEHGMIEGRDLLTPKEKHYVRELYDGEVAYADDLLGEVLRSLGRVSSSNRPTIIWVISDHGEEFWDHGKYYHGHTLYDELLHVPMMISAPGAAPGKRIKERVASFDLMPTLCELCGVPQPKTFRGRSLVPYLGPGGGPIPSVPIFSEKDIYQRPSLSVIRDNYKLIQLNNGYPEMLFDLNADPGEKHNLEAARREVVKRLERLLAARQKSLRRIDAPTRKKQKDNIKDLKTLGYL
jgi:arylsulfatase A-like enzyme